MIHMFIVTLTGAGKFKMVLSNNRIVATDRAVEWQWSKRGAK